MNADLAALVVGALAVWRVTHLLNAEDGPWEMSVRLRRWGGDGFFGEALDCFLCLSLWVAAPVAAMVSHGPLSDVLFWLALSAGAILLERVTTREDGAGSFIAEKEPYDVLRKPKTNGGEPSDAREPARSNR